MGGLYPGAGYFGQYSISFTPSSGGGTIVYVYRYLVIVND
jgi:hypothetical protein